MKFSILLPTRNRLELLRYAVQSVLDQDYDDWEVIVSDNDSTEDVLGFVESLKDQRIIYRRTETFLPVTDNWNLALETSRGDYAIMLGDDDCLLGSCLSVAKHLLESHDLPEMMYTEAVQYQYPGVQPGQNAAFTQFGYCEFLRSRTVPFFLGHDEALALVGKSMAFKIAFSFNMQHSFLSRAAIERLRLKGHFFQSPYPDYYATNALFLAAARILVCPWPMVAIGISPKSFGFYYVNQREADGTQFLRNIAEPGLVDRVRQIVMPGTDMNTSWLLAMEAIKRNFGATFDLRVSYWRYRFLQFRHLYRMRTSSMEFLSVLWRHGNGIERIFGLSIVALLALVTRLLPRQKRFGIQERVLDLIHRSHPNFDPRRREVPYKDILDLYHDMDAHPPRAESPRVR